MVEILNKYCSLCGTNDKNEKCPNYKEDVTGYCLYHTGNRYEVDYCNCSYGE